MKCSVMSDECLEGSAVDWICFPEIVDFLPCITGNIEAFQPCVLLSQGSFEDDSLGVSKNCVLYWVSS
jgi:hypothetical protein